MFASSGLSSNEGPCGCEALQDDYGLTKRQATERGEPQRQLQDGFLLNGKRIMEKNRFYLTLSKQCVQTTPCRTPRFSMNECGMERVHQILN
jgi:hypothetical protein